MGLAQKLFLQKKLGFQCKSALHESFLERLRDEYHLNPIDFILAEKLLKNSGKSEAVVALLTHLSLAVRNGHLLIKYDNGEILPKVASLWMKEAPLVEREVKEFEALILDGFKEITENRAYEALFRKSADFHTCYLCKEGNRLYFQKYYVLEKSVQLKLSELAGHAPLLKLDLAEIGEKVEALQKEGTLLKLQREAIEKAAEKSVMFLSGGPGTGKTYTAGFLIQTLLEASPQKKMKIVAAAPTGKAAANLEKSLRRFLDSSFKAKTLHSCLGIKEGGKPPLAPPKRIDADLILIDEASMIDISLMNKLLQAVKPGTRLIFLGDPHQLPSVEAGSLLLDFIRMLPSSTTLLSHSLRAELQEIVDFAKAVNEGDSESALHLLKNGKAVSLQQKGLDQKEFDQEEIFQHAAPHVPFLLDENLNPEELLAAFNGFRILSPIRKGLFGVDAMNAYFFQRLSLPHLEKRSVMLPIMLTQNASNLELFNGETGVLILHPGQVNMFHVKQGDFAYFPDKEKGYRKIPALLLPSYELAYCLSVHKAQGSEFLHVVTLLPKGSEYFGRKVLYTAVTRAKRKLEIFGSIEMIVKTIQEEGLRLSGFI